ncbi:tandem-95 repeat protein, partial [bacterium]|nr:tandem-95 repeat protein [bacterium]
MKSWTYFRFILILLFLGACSRNPLGEDLQQPILNLGFFLSQSCANNFNQDSPYSCQISTSEVITGISYSIDPILTTCTWASINATTGIISGIPNDNNVGVCQIVVNAQNSQRRAQSYPYLITVNNLPATLNIANAAAIFEDTGSSVIRADAAVQASEEGMGTYFIDNAGTTAPRCFDNAAVLSVDVNTGAVNFGPAADYQGTCNIRVAFDDGNGVANSIVTSEFSINVININDAPIIAAIANQVTNVSTPINVNMNVTDIDSGLSCSALSLSTSSSNPAVVISPADISFSGTAPNCVMTINPQPLVLGSTTITVTVTDGVLNDSTSFLLDVLAIPQPPVLLPIANQNGFEDVPLVFTIDASDPDTVLACNGTFLSATSSNPALLPVANIAFSGAIPNCTVTLTPTLNNSGSSNITITLIDGTGFTVNQSFTATFNPVNDIPTITGIANQTVNEDTATSALAFTIGDLETGGALTCAGSVVGTSSNTTIIPNGNIVVTGVAPNCNVVVTPALNQNGGPVTITLTVTDSGTPLPTQSANTTFDITVTPINDAPTITGIANQTINEETPTGSLAFTIGDLETGGALTCAGSVVGTSSNTTIIPNGNIVVTGVAPNCNVVVTPDLNQNGGPVTITLTVTDSGTPLPTQSANTTFDVTVNPINDVPTISGIANQTINEDNPTGSLAFTIGDLETGGALTCAGSVVGTSSNTTIIPNGNIVVTGVAPNCNVVVTPALNQNGGPVTVTLTVTDSGTPLPTQSTNTTFDITVTPVNDAPVISVIADQNTGENTPLVLNFNVSDIDSILTCTALNLSATSSDGLIVPVPNIVFGGAIPNCTATITPITNANGITNIVFTVDDGGIPNLQASEAFALTVAPVNDPPTITGIANQTINEDTPTGALTFTIGDIETGGALTCAGSVVGTSSNTTIIPNGNIVVTGVAPNCNVVVTPALNQNGGPVTITLTVTDSGTPLPTQSTNTTFDVTVTPINDIPTITGIANQTVNEDTATGALTFTIGDVETGGALTCAGSVVGTSSNTTIIPNGNIVVTGVAPNCNVVVTPALNQNGGPVTVTLTVTDSGTPLPVANNNTTFDVTVTAINDIPTISGIANQTINEDTATGSLAFTIGDVETGGVLTCSGSVLGTSSNTTIIPNGNIVVTGVAPNCNVVVTPALNQNGGPVTVTLTVTDSGTPMPVANNATTFDVTVTPINDIPTISGIANQTVNEDTATGSLAFTIGDVETGGALTCAGSVVGTSSNTTIIPNGNIVVTGVAPNCNVVVTPALNQNGGPVTVTLTVTDSGTPLPTLAANATFDVTVTPINDIPTITGIANQTVNEDTATGSLAFTIGDVETGGALTCAGSVVGTSSNTTIIPNGNIVITGVAPNCNVVVTPALNQNGGPVTVTLTVTDSGTPMPVANNTTTFDVTVNAVNDAPTITGIANQTVNEDTATGALTFTIGDVETGGALTCAGSVVGTSSNLTLIPNGNIVITGVAPNCNVVVTPAANQNGGPVTVTLTVTDSGTPMPVANNTTTFDVTVTAINDIPTITGIANQTINEDNSTGSLAFTIGDLETGGALTCAGSVVGTSSNTTIIPNGNIVVTGVAPNCNVVVTPAANQNGGPVTVTLTVTDSGTPLPVANNNTTFDVTVNAVNDAPVVLPIANQSTPENTPLVLNFNVSDIDSILTCSALNLSATSSNPAVVAVVNIVFTGTIPNCIATITPVASVNGATTIAITADDGGTPNLQDTQSFVLTVTPFNDPPVMDPISSVSTPEDVSTLVNFTVDDIDNVLNCSTSIVATTNNAALVPVVNVVFGGTIPNCTATITPLANANGTVDLTFTVSDGGVPVKTDAQTFTLTVNAVNDAPTITGIANQTVNEDTATGSLAFTIGDIETGGALTCAGSVVGSSSNTTIIPNGNIVVTGVAPNCSVVVTPALNQNGGPVTVTLTVTDSGTPLPTQSANTTFDITVTPINDAPTIT